MRECCPTPNPLCFNGTRSIVPITFSCGIVSRFHGYFCMVRSKIFSCGRLLKYKYECESMNGRIVRISHKWSIRQHSSTSVQTLRHFVLTFWSNPSANSSKVAAKEFAFWLEVVPCIWIKCILESTTFQLVNVILKHCEMGLIAVFSVIVVGFGYTCNQLFSLRKLSLN